MFSPDVLKVRVRHGVAGQVQATAELRYRFPDAPDQLTTCDFLGSVYGGTVLTFWDGQPPIRVSDPGRFGDALTADWVRRYFA